MSPFPTSRAGRAGTREFRTCGASTGRRADRTSRSRALTHGNEVCGAIVLDWLLRRKVRPVRGTLTLIFANAAAYESFDATDPYAARCLDEDFNRLWDGCVLDSPRRTQELDRARAAAALLRRDGFPARPAFDDRSVPGPGPRRTPRQGTAPRACDRNAAVHHRRRRSSCRTPLARLCAVRRSRRPAQRAADRMRPALGARHAARRATVGVAVPAAFRRVRPCVPGRVHRAARHAAAADDRDHRRRHDRQRVVLVRAAGARDDDDCARGHAARARRRTRHPHAVRRLRADHAGAATRNREKPPCGSGAISTRRTSNAADARARRSPRSACRRRAST